MADRRTGIVDRRARVIGVPSDYGTDRRGVDMGPSAIRYAGLSEAIAAIDVGVDDRGDIDVPPSARYAADWDGEGPTDAPDADDCRLADVQAIDAIEEVSGDLADAVAASATGDTPLVLGGDHSVTIGTLNGVSRSVDPGVVWFDAHGDFNTPATTPSGNVHGMSLAAALGRGPFDGTWADAGVDPANVALVGVRELDPGERDALSESPVTTLTMSAIDDRGMGSVVEEALDVATAGTDGVHVSVDLDFLDPDVAPGVGTPVRGGVTYREAHAAMEAVATAHAAGDTLQSLELVEVNPVLDRANRTAELAVELAASVFGKRVL